MQKLGRLNFSQDISRLRLQGIDDSRRRPAESICSNPTRCTSGRAAPYMLIALPNIDGTFACILFLPFEGRESFATLDTREKAAAFFPDEFRRCSSIDAAAERKLFEQSHRRDGHDQMLAVASRRESAAAGRRGSRHRPVLRPGNELRIRRLHASFWNCWIVTAPTGRNSSPNSNGTEEQYGRHRRSRPRKFRRNARSRRRIPGFFQEESRARTGIQISALFCSQVCDGHFSPRALIPSRFRAERSRIVCSQNCAMRSPDRRPRLAKGGSARFTATSRPWRISKWPRKNLKPAAMLLWR